MPRTIAINNSFNAIPAIKPKSLSPIITITKQTKSFAIVSKIEFFFCIIVTSFLNITLIVAQIKDYC